MLSLRNVSSATWHLFGSIHYSTSLLGTTSGTAAAIRVALVASRDGRFSSSFVPWARQGGIMTERQPNAYLHNRFIHRESRSVLVFYLGTCTYVVIY
mmetsp:Transcript_12203/g.18815  ORF Transcript_12203/g.18815 Transcript_12203/m.18815 type:complete len:97 (-) Transcript_12203:357-647(-)